MWELLVGSPNFSILPPNYCFFIYNKGTCREVDTRDPNFSICTELLDLHLHDRDLGSISDLELMSSLANDLAVHRYEQAVSNGEGSHKNVLVNIFSTLTIIDVKYQNEVGQCNSHTVPSPQSKKAGIILNHFKNSVSSITPDMMMTLMVIEYFRRPKPERRVKAKFLKMFGYNIDEANTAAVLELLLGSISHESESLATRHLLRAAVRLKCQAVPQFVIEEVPRDVEVCAISLSLLAYCYYIYIIDVYMHTHTVGAMGPVPAVGRSRE